MTFNTSNSSHSDHDHCGGHAGGVKLVSWRWCEYQGAVGALLVLLLAGILKIIFHHLPTITDRLLDTKNSLNTNPCLLGLKKAIAILLSSISYLPESCVLMIAGMILGSMIYSVGIIPEFTDTLFFNVLLPPIIMDSAFAIYNKDFGHNFPTIIIFAVFGTIFNIFTIGFSLWGAHETGAMSLDAPLDLLNCLTFSSLISAVDPVAVLAIFQEIGVNVSLYFLIFGESLLNDGVTIVLYNTMVALHHEHHGTMSPDTMEYVKAFFSFFTVVLGGFLIGIIMGLISSFIVKFTRHCRELEPFTVLSMIYLAFILAELFHWSGIISILGCGIVQKRYAFRNISKKSFWTIKYGVKTAASFADCCIFIYLGLVSVDFRDIWRSWNTGFALWTCFFCTLFRFASVFMFSLLMNKTDYVDYISIKEQFVTAYGGLRGAVGFCLALIVSKDNESRNLFLTTAIFMVYFTTFVQGGTIKLVVKFLKIDRQDEEKTRYLRSIISDDVHEQTIDNVMGGIESVVGGMHQHKAYELFSHYDTKYIQPWVLHKKAVNLLELQFEKIAMKEHYAKLYGPRVLINQETFSLDTSNDTIQDQHSKIETKLDVDPSLTSHQLLQRGFSAHPYTVYKNKSTSRDMFQRDSLEDLREAMRNEKKRTNILWGRAFSKANQPLKPEDNPSSSDDPNNSLLGKSEDDRAIATIFNVYKEVKRQSAKEK